MIITYNIDASQYQTFVTRMNRAGLALLKGFQRLSLQTKVHLKDHLHYNTPFNYSEFAFSKEFIKTFNELPIVPQTELYQCFLYELKNSFPKEELNKALPTSYSTNINEETDV